MNFAWESSEKEHTGSRKKHPEQTKQSSYFMYIVLSVELFVSLFCRIYKRQWLGLLNYENDTFSILQKYCSLLACALFRKYVEHILLMSLISTSPHMTWNFLMPLSLIWTWINQWTEFFPITLHRIPISMWYKYISR